MYATRLELPSIPIESLADFQRIFQLARRAFEEILGALFDVTSVVRIGDQIKIAGFVFEYKAFEALRIEFFAADEFPFGAFPEITADAKTATPIQVIIRVLPVANFCGNGNDALVFIVAQRHENVDGLEIPVRFRNVRRFGNRLILKT